MSELLRLFPGLAVHPWRPTSPPSKEYNCIAWAAGETDRWWWPSDVDYWPEPAPRRDAIDAFAAAFATLGFERCDSAALEPDFEKVVLYADASGRPTHAARQLDDGTWTSKLGENLDIAHDLEGLDDGVYGRVVRVLRRPRGRSGS